MRDSVLLFTWVCDSLILVGGILIWFFYFSGVQRIYGNKKIRPFVIKTKGRIIRVTTLIYNRFTTIASTMPDKLTLSEIRQYNGCTRLDSVNHASHLELIFLTFN